MEIDKRQTTLHRESETAVINVGGVGASVPVSEQAVGTEGVVIRSARGGGDRKRHLAQDLWFEDALRPKKRDSGAVEDETFGENRAREYVSVP